MTNRRAPRPDDPRSRRGVSRRALLEIGAASGAALVGAQLGCSASEAPPDAAPARSASAAPPAPPAPPPPPPAEDRFELAEVTLAALREGLDAGRYTARSLAEAYLARIQALDRRGPSLRSILTINPDALAIADALDQERKVKGARGPLHGVPIVVKDNLDTADRMPTTAGSAALERSIAPRDSGVVERLRAAGAVLLGKTNLSEWANIRSSRSTSGWSALGGQTKNPYVLSRNPCGSSSGTGAAVSANLAAAGLGTETDGSIVCPAHHCGLVGVKPTVGLVSRAGIIPISHTQDTAGPMARTVADAAALLSVLAGEDPRDPATQAARGHAEADYGRFLDPKGLAGARLGVARNLFGKNPAVNALLEAALDVLRKGGATLVDPADVPRQRELDDPEMLVLLYEFKANLGAYLASLGPGAPVKSLADVIAFNENHADREMPYFGQELFLRAEALGPLTSKEYLDALAKCRKLSREKGIDAVLGAHRLDAFVAPTGGPAWTTDLLNGDHFVSGSSTPAAVAGYPAITLPAGFVRGVPVGISFFGAAWSEPKLLRIAYAYEQATKHRRPPRFLHEADGDGG